jgi:hypothetical protein
VIDEQHSPARVKPLRYRHIKHATGRLVQAGPRLIEHQQSRPGQQGLGDRDLLAHPLGQRPQRRLRIIRRAEPLQPLISGGSHPGRGQAMDTAHVLQVLTR